MITQFATEDQFSAAFHTEVRNKYPLTWKLCFHVPNEGKKTMAEAMKLKAMGVTAGVPDHLLIWEWKLFGFELKLPNGIVSPAQKKLHPIWIAAGATIFICYDLESAMSGVKMVMENSIVLGNIYILKQNTIKRLSL